jgi:hypothetical protein
MIAASNLPMLEERSDRLGREFEFASFMVRK